MSTKNKSLYNNVLRRIIHNNPKEEITQYPSNDECMEKMCYSHKMDYYSTLKMAAMLIYAIT